MDLKAQQKSKQFHTWFFPVAFVFVLWVIKSCEVVFHKEFFRWGVYPREIKGLIGVIAAPLLHGDFAHLFSNTIPLLVLGAGLFYFYRQIGYKVFLFIYLISGLWVWISARPSYHIGASGVVYGLAAFLFLSGVLRQHKYLMAFSLFVVFLYGSLIWGILPLQQGISWESHLMGALAGIVSAIYYRKIGLQKEQFVWEDSPDDEDENALWKQTEIEKFIPDEQLQQPEITITYKVKQSAEKPE
ncbi:MAG: rhomboid family intramembrane serine protease [Bacteroidetes bacterium]|nr:rhomboid family intramembrane serine protease [Bacteroidota bacterium]MBK9672566.1 rhomboid family intramembrane serine protease [Bacteroidota bacterium]MBK9800205.1 rhomboid family intramembrane serine protease [Bacteroidota bacterium]MBP6413069.1 rhomboid family intramembrane serine protease [Bacteroidia bacterium]